MTNQPTEAQIKEFWEWCGWQILKTDSSWVSIRPDGSSYMSTVDEKCLPLLWEPIDLNNLFLYAVPKLKSKTVLFSWVMYLIWDYAKGKEPNPALALFWVIWEVIHDKPTDR